MREVTLSEQSAVLTKMHRVNDLLRASYPGTKRIVCLKIDRAGISVYVHGEDLSVQRYLPVDPVEFSSTVADDLRALHDELDRIIDECNETREKRSIGAMEAAGA